MRLVNVYKDYKYRNLINKYKIKLHVYTFLLNNTNITPKCKFFLMSKLTIIKKFLSRSRLQTLCFETNSTKSVFSIYNQSRHQFRSLSKLGYLSGIRKSSW